MASFSPRPGGWLARVRKVGFTPRQAVFKTKAQARAWAAQVEADMSAGRAGAVADRSFGELIEHYIKTHVVNLDGERSERLRLGRVLKDPIAQVRLQEFGPEHVSAWRDRRRQQVSADSVLREWSSLSHACEMAIKEWRWLHTNPFRTVTRPEKAQPRNRRVSQDEIDRLLLACGYEPDAQALTTAQARVGAAMLFALETAMRAGEICAMNWEDVDLGRRVARVRAAVRGARKTKRGRDVPLSDQALHILAQLGGGGDGTVFHLSAAILDALFRKAKARAMIDGLHFHDTRREALTRMVEDKELDVMTLAKISGHSDLRILQAVYYSPDMARVADERFRG